jgi:hypothetical protein
MLTTQRSRGAGSFTLTAVGHSKASLMAAIAAKQTSKHHPKGLQSTGPAIRAPRSWRFR